MFEATTLLVNDLETLPDLTAYVSPTQVYPSKQKDRQLCEELCAAFRRGGGKITRVPTQR
jgi:hypothetical protein